MLGIGVGLTLRILGRDHPLGSPKAQLIMSILMLSPGRPVLISDIVDHVWGERPPPKATQALQAYVSRLRRQLRQLVGERARIVARGGTYTLDVDPEMIDLHRVRALWRQATAIAGSGDPELAVRLLHEAEALWPGDAMMGLPGEWARRMSRTLADERADVQRDRIALELRLGRHAAVLDELRGLVAHRPDDEMFVGQLMTALYRADRQSDALDVYRGAYRYLVEQHGTRPGAALSSLHLRILRGDPDLAVTPVYRSEVASQPDTLLPDTPHFTGREQEIEAVSAVRAEGDGTPTVVIQGMPGVGKSALALHIAHRIAARYPDARLYLELRAHDPTRPPLDTATALSALLRMLGIPATRIPSSFGDRVAMWHAELAYRRAIVILDDVAGAEQIRPLLGTSSSSLVLITTRSRLDLPSEVERVLLGVLPREDAAALASRLAGAHADPYLIGEVVRVSGGLPLAITLNAPRAGAAGNGARPCSGGTGTAWIADGSGHDEIDAAFEMSYRDLTPGEKSAFRRLGLSPCRDVTVMDAAALCDTTQEEARIMVETLVRHHLLQPAAPGRYRFHDLVRTYARERAEREDPEGGNRRAVRRLLDQYVETVGTAMAAIHLACGATCERPRGEQIGASDARRWLGDEWSTVLRLAQYAAEHEWKAYTVGLMRMIADYLDMESLWEDAAMGHALALRACQDLGDSRGIARASLDLGFARFRTGRHDNALSHTRKALSLYKSLDDRGAIGKCQDQMGVIHWASARYREALAHYQEAQANFRSSGDVKGEADALGHSGIAYWHLGRYQDSLDLLGRALEAYRGLGDRRGEAKALNNMGDVQKHRGLHRDAIRLYQESLEIFKQIEGKQNHAILHSNRGDIHQYKHRFSAALACYRVAMATFLEIGDRRNQADILNSIGSTYLHMGGAEESLIHFEKAKGIAEEIADDYQMVRALVGIADVNLAAGRYEAARDTYNSAIRTARAIGDLYQESRAHRGLADTWERLDDLEATRISLRQALNLLVQLDLPEAEEVRIRLEGLGAEDSPQGRRW
ncbi:AfsR/SARP family transcriptional regulator [Sphaerisporangium album]|nr:tetratricopeptide repeat protein [Sphaerisporangium album]